jgi:DNA-binding HxlR family transcriptional regulator
MKSYGQYCPIARGAEIFAERWTPIIVRNLLVGCQTFTEICEGAPGIPRSLLSQRLRLLERYGIVARRGAGRGTTYHLTACGQELTEVCYALGVWGARWLETTPDHLDAHLALWYLSRLVDRGKLPPHRVVIRFDLTDGSRSPRYWLVLSREETEVCVHPPGFAEDLVVTTDIVWLVKWHTGAVTLAAALRSGHFRVDGPPSLLRALQQWGGLSPFAQVHPAADRPSPQPPTEQAQQTIEPLDAQRA